MKNLPQVMETCGDSLDTTRMNPGARIAYTAILGALDQPEKARRVARDLARDTPIENLLEEERAILAPYLSKG